MQNNRNQTRSEKLCKYVLLCFALINSARIIRVRVKFGARGYLIFTCILSRPTHPISFFLVVRSKMLDFFTIFSKGGILLWCFKGAGLLPEEWASFRPTVNAFIKTVMLQVRLGKKFGKSRYNFKMIIQIILPSFYFFSRHLGDVCQE